MHIIHGLYEKGQLDEVRAKEFVKIFTGMGGRFGFSGYILTLTIDERTVFVPALHGKAVNHGMWHIPPSEPYLSSAAWFIKKGCYPSQKILVDCPDEVGKLINNYLYCLLLSYLIIYYNTLLIYS